MRHLKFFRLLFCAICLPTMLLFGIELSLANFKTTYVTDASWEEGCFSGKPNDSGSALVYNFSEDTDFKEVNSCQIDFSEFPEEMTVEDFSLSIRGEEKIYLLPEKGSTVGKQQYHWDKKLRAVKQLRIYFNKKKKLNGEATTFQLKSISFVALENQAEPDRRIMQLPMPERKRIVPSTMLIPRILPKYDLMKNYLGGYSKGSGTFTDRPLFFDRSLAADPLPQYNKLNSLEGFNRQLQVALLFTDGVGFFGPAREERFIRMVDFAEAKKYKNVILWESAPNTFLNLDRSRLFIEKALSSDSIIKVNGKVLIGSYHGDAYTPEKWQQTIAPLREQYPDKLCFMIELRSLGYRINSMFKKNGGWLTESEVEEFKEQIRAYLRVADGVNFSASNHIAIQAPGYPENIFNAAVYEKFLVPIFASVVSEAEFSGQKLLGLSAHKVYCQVRNTQSNVDEQGTLGLRRSLEIALSANPDYILLPEWNEVNEYTHIAPVVSDAMATARVINAIRKKETASVEQRWPNLILSFRQENDLAAPIPIELLGLTDANGDGDAYEVTLRLYGQDDVLLKEFPAVTFSQQKIEDVFYLEPAQQFSGNRFLYPELRLRWKGKTEIIRTGLPHLRLLTANNPYHRYVKIPLQDLPSAETISSNFQFSAGKVEVYGVIETPEKITSIELMADDIPLAAVDPRNEYAPVEGYELLCWRRQVPVLDGYSEDVVCMTARKGKIMPRTPHQYSLAGMETPTLEGNILRGKIGGGASIREFFFYATPDAELEIEQRGETVSLKVSDVLENLRWRHCGKDGVSWQLMTFTELPEMPFPIDSNRVEYRLSAKLASLPMPVYYLRVVTRAGRVFRSKPVLEKPFTGATKKLCIWNLLTDKLEHLSVPEELCRNIEYDFNPRLNYLLADKTDCRSYDAILGGFDYWTHSSAMGWNFPIAPEWLNEDNRWLLRFKPGACLLLRPPVFPKSAFDLQLEFRLQDTEEQTLLDVVGNLLPVVVVNGQLQGAIVTQKGKFEWKGAGILQPSYWYKLRLKYDLQELQVCLNDLIIAQIPAQGLFQKGWFLSIGGHPLDNKINPRQVQVPNPDLPSSDADQINYPDPGFNLNADIRALKIYNSFNP